MNLDNVEAIKLPKIFYSTWGNGGYSSNWMNYGNSWMYSLVKFVEANIDTKKDKHILPLFEKLTASDYPFMYTGLDQKDFAAKTFFNLFTELIDKIEIVQKEVIAAFPIDPFWCYFTFVKFNEDNCGSEETQKIKFKIYKLGYSNSGNIEQKIFNVLDTQKINKAKFDIYFQRFLLYPNLYYSFEIADRKLSITFKMPEWGIPFIMSADGEILYLYKSRTLYENLKKLWGGVDELPPIIEINKGSKNIYRREHLQRILPVNPKAAIFKYNKEAYSLLRFKNLSLFNPVVIFDDKVSIDDAAEYINIGKTYVPVKNDLAEIEKFDFNVLILTCSLNFESELEVITKLVTKALLNNLPIICLYDDIIKYDHIQTFLNEKNINNIFRIGVTNRDLENIEIEKYNNYVPQKVLGLFGTDSVQGKFTTQILLREELKKNIEVKHFSTEPTGVLIGADVGFSRVENDDESKNLAFYRKIIEEMEKESDIIIVGGQNSIIFSLNEKGDYSKNASTRIFQTFLPRWIILTVSVDTEITTIVESLAYIKSLNEKYDCNSEIIAFAMLVGRKIRGERWTETYFIDVNDNIVKNFMERIEKATGIRAYIVPDEIEGLAKNIIKHL